MHLEQPLSEKEFDELDQFLLSDRCSDDAMTMDTLHGYLTAIAIGPESIMPAYSFLRHRQIDPTYISDRLTADSRVGVPYTEDMITEARADFLAQADPDLDASGLQERYPGAQARNFDRQAGVTEMDALIAYLQVMGTMVDFSTFQPDEHR